MDYQVHHKRDLELDTPWKHDALHEQREHGVLHGELGEQRHCRGLRVLQEHGEQRDLMEYGMS